MVSESCNGFYVLKYKQTSQQECKASKYGRTLTLNCRLNLAAQLTKGKNNLFERLTKREQSKEVF